LAVARIVSAERTFFVEHAMTGPAPAKPAPYNVKRIEPVMRGKDVQARVFTLAPNETIPWHFHRQCSDHYFVLEGVLSIATRGHNAVQTAISTGGSYKIAPETPHLIANHGTADCRFLLLQGVGTSDWNAAG
jgi:mannose-6-phosphate isomerase-like protein (cupin superfamily)